MPRHGFVHRFRAGDGQLRDFDAAPEDCLDLIYSDLVLAHVDARGKILPSTNSQPSFVLWLVHLLDVQLGQRILEIGSGSGWLAGILAHLAGPAGHVTGIEIIASLAGQSRADLAACGLGNVTILAQDGALGCAAAAPFDKVVITAGVWDLPEILFDQVAPGRLLLVPVELAGSSACRVALLRHEAGYFVEMQGMRGWFVPLTGPSQRRPAAGEDEERRSRGGWPSTAAGKPHRLARADHRAARGHAHWCGRKMEERPLFVSKNKQKTLFNPGRAGFSARGPA